MHRKEVAHSDGSYVSKSRRRTWLTIWDKVKSHGTLIDWCTGREWPVNCMTVISARWQSNMPFQRQWKWHISDGQLWGDIEWAIELLYNSVKAGSQFWRPDPLVTRCCRENSTQRSGPAGLRLSSPGERERHNADGHKAVEVNILQFCSVSNSLSHATFQIKGDVYFFKEVFARLYYCVRMYSACICVYMHI